MFNALAAGWFRLLGGQPAFRVYGKGRRETIWREVAVFASRRRDRDSRWPAPLFRGTCITWSAGVIAVGWDFAESVLLEQKVLLTTRGRPLEVPGGRLRGGRVPTASAVLAHECGHTWQARRLSWLYLPIGALFTLWREGPHWWNSFENQASAEGQFGGLVPGSIHPRLQSLLS